MNHPAGLRKNIILKDYCTLNIGGPARYFIEVKTIAEMHEAIVFCKDLQLKYLVLGKGSNILFDDLGFNGAVILNKIDFFEQPLPGTFHVGGGYSFSLLGVQTARQGWGGLEFASGIPGTVGGAVYMNAGANGRETCQALESVDFVTENGLETIPKKDLTFAYRFSPFQKRSGAIAGATFTLTPQADARHNQVEIVKGRIKTQPYQDKSAGCIFVNPPGESAGALIDKCGLKGTMVGGAQVSTKHANFLINADASSCREMLELISLVRTKVKEDASIELETEVRYFPYED